MATVALSAAAAALEASGFLGPTLGALSVGVAVVSFFVRSSASDCSLVTTGTLVKSNGFAKASALEPLT